MWDFSKLLGSLAGEDAAGFLGGVTDPSAKKRMPPKTELTPSESAGQEMVAGMHEAATPPTTAPVSGFRQGLAGGLKSAGAAMGQMASSPDVPMRPTQIYDQPIITPYQATQVPRFAQGGVVPDGWSQVGDGGNDPNAEEWIHKKGDKVVVIPKNPPTNPDNVMSQPITLPQQNGDYTIQQGRPGTQPVAVSPQTPMGTADDITNPNLATQGNQPAQQEQQPVDPLQALQQKYADTAAQPIKKQSFWKDFGTNLILGANAFFNPQNGPSPMVGWGAVKRQNELNALDRQIKPLEAIQAQKQASDTKQAQTQKIYADTIKQLADANHLRVADFLAGKKWDWQELNGRIFKKNADGSVDPWIDPETGKQGVNKTGVPIERLLSDGAKVGVTGPQALTADSQMQEANARREQEANIFNARSQQDVDKWNADTKLKTDIANQKAMADWQSAKLSKAVDLIKSKADLFAKSGEAQGLAEQAQTLAQQGQDLQARIDDEVDPAEQAKLQKELDGLTKQMGTLQGKFGAVAGQFGKSQELVNLYNQSDIQKPKPVRFTPRKFDGGVQPVQRGSASVANVRTPAQRDAVIASIRRQGGTDADVQAFIEEWNKTHK